MNGEKYGICLKIKRLKIKKKRGRSNSLVQNSIILYEWRLKEESKTQGLKDNKKVIKVRSIVNVHKFQYYELIDHVFRIITLICNALLVSLSDTVNPMRWVAKNMGY